MYSNFIDFHDAELGSYQHWVLNLVHTSVLVVFESTSVADVGCSYQVCPFACKNHMTCLMIQAGTCMMMHLGLVSSERTTAGSDCCTHHFRASNNVGLTYQDSDGSCYHHYACCGYSLALTIPTDVSRSHSHSFAEQLWSLTDHFLSRQVCTGFEWFGRLIVVQMFEVLLPCSSFFVCSFCDFYYLSQIFLKHFQEP